MRSSTLPLLTRMAMLIAVGVAASYVTAIPLFGARLFPAQHALNVVAGAMLGPWYGAVVAFLISLIRNLLGTGTPLAFPGSIFGVIMAGLLYRYTRSRLAAMAGEVVGTGLLGAVAAYPIAVLLLGNATVAAASMTFFIIPFGLSSLVGALIGGLILSVLKPLISARHSS